MIPHDFDDLHPSDSPPRITQEMLREFLRLQAEAKEFARLKKFVWQALADGADVEPGFLSLSASVVLQRRRTLPFVFQSQKVTKMEQWRLRQAAPGIPTRRIDVKTPCLKLQKHDWEFWN